MLNYLLLLSLALFCSFSWADSLQAQLSDCKKIADNNSRLACFDQIHLPAPQQTPAVQPSQAASNAAPAVVLTEQDFGFEHKAEVKDKLQASTTMQLKKLTTTAYGLLVFTFENGQVWRQVSKETFPAKAGKTYVLGRGALNSFFLNEEGSGRKTRVRRDK